MSFFLCEYLNCVIFKNLDFSLIWLLRNTNGIKTPGYQEEKYKLLDDEKKDHIIASTIWKITNGINTHINDYTNLIDANKTDSFDEFKKHLEKYNNLMKSQNLSDEDKKFKTFINSLKTLTVEITIDSFLITEYFKIMSKNISNVFVFDIILAFSIVHKKLEFDMNLNNGSMKTDFFEPIKKFVESNEPDAQLYLPILYDHDNKSKTHKEKNKTWMILVFKKEKATRKSEDSMKRTKIYFSSLFLPYSNNKFLAEKLSVLHDYIRGKILENIDEIIDPKIKLMMYFFIQNWKVHTVPSYHEFISEEKHSYLAHEDRPFDTGIYIIEYARHIAFNLVMDFDDESMYMFRERIIRELIEKKIIRPKTPSDNSKINNYKLYENKKENYLHYSTYSIGKEFEHLVDNLVIELKTNQSINNPATCVSTLSSQDDNEYLTTVPLKRIKSTGKISSTLIQTPLTVNLDDYPTTSNPQDQETTSSKSSQSTSTINIQKFSTIESTESITSTATTASTTTTTTTTTIESKSRYGPGSKIAQIAKKFQIDKIINRKKQSSSDNIFQFPSPKIQSKEPSVESLTETQSQKQQEVLTFSQNILSLNSPTSFSELSTPPPIIKYKKQSNDSNSPKTFF